MQERKNRKIIVRRLWRCFQLAGRPFLRHGVFALFMTLLMAITYNIVGEPHTKHPGFYVAQFVMDLYVLCGILCLLPKSIAYPVKYAIYALAYLLCFTEAFVYRRFFLAFSPTMLHLVLETNDGEASEFIDSVIQSAQFAQTIQTYAIILLANVVAGRWGHTWYTWLYGKLKRKRLPGTKWPRRAGRVLQGIVFPSLSLLLLTTTLGAWCKEKWKMMDFMMIENTTEAEKISGNVFYSPPYRVIYSLKFALVVRKDTERLIANMRQLAAEPRNLCAIPAEAPADIVVIIGESYNKHHAQCYGYPLSTTPNLSAMQEKGELTVFGNAVSPWNITANAFKNMLSTHSMDEPGNWTHGVLFPALLHHEGWNTAFISNQFYPSRRQNRSDFNGSFFLNDNRLDSLCFDYRNTRHYRYDGGIVSEISRCRLQRHNMIIVHLMGQHVMYAERYPKDSCHFTADDIRRPDLNVQERSIVAAYDNATRYNDAVVARIIGKFRRRDAIVVYLADHGDEVYDGTLRMFGRNHSAQLTQEILRNEFEIPLVLWTSPEFVRKRPETVERIRAAAQLPFASDDLPHLILGIAGSKIPYYRPQRDILSPMFKARRRNIKHIAEYERIMSEENTETPAPPPASRREPAKSRTTTTSNHP